MVIHFEVLFYLNENGRSYTDLKEPFYGVLVSGKERLEFISTLNSLQKDGLIEMSSRDYKGLCDTMGGVLSPLNQFTIKARITQYGIDSLLQSLKVKEEQTKKLKLNMGTGEIKNLDKLLRVLYKKKYQAWCDVYTEAGVDKASADFLYKIAEADGYVEVTDKGDGRLDGHTVALTDKGISFFTRTNYEEELTRIKSPQPNITNVRNINTNYGTQGNVNLGNKNKATIGDTNEKEKGNKFLKFLSENITYILIIAVAVIGFIIKYF